jgi:DNA-directed RNA polymerase specialized sigma24 family protein
VSRLSRAERRRLRKFEKAVERMEPLDREIFLGIRVDELSYRQLANKHGMTLQQVEQHFANALFVLMQMPTEKPPDWWQFWRW